jgi:peptidoglycan/xylan/chitin deacetylase (PgdA/CDA1 family)
MFSDDSLLKTSINYFSTLMPNFLFKKIISRDLIIPLYHVISDLRVKHVENIYHVKSTKTFEKDLDFFLKFYNPISVDDFYNSILNKSKVDKPSFLLTFDDGLKEFKEVISPILIRKGIPAICFLNSGFLDNKNLFYRHKASLLINEIDKIDEHSIFIRKWKSQNFISNLSLKKMILSIDYNKKHLLDELAIFINYDWNDYLSSQKPYLSTEDICFLQKKGFWFGAHSIDHPRYNKISFEEQIRQTESSLKFINERFNIKEKLFALPFSDKEVNEGFFNKVYQQNTVDITFGTSGFSKSRKYFNHQQRISFDENISAESIMFIYSFFQFSKKVFRVKQN